MDEAIIILSEDEDLACDGLAHDDSSVLFVEQKEENVVPARPLPGQASEEDLVVTFSRRAEVLPHARHDCPVHPFTIVLSQCPKASAFVAKGILFQRVIDSVRRLMVTSDLPSAFIHKLQCFYQGLNLHVSFRHLRNSLCVRPWDDMLLVSVLKGQNVTGIRKDKGRKDILLEQISVVLLRAELLQCQCRYRELCRYLRVVQTDDSILFQKLRDLIPLYMCMAGDLFNALPRFFSTVVSLSPALFHLYLRVFDTATAPRGPISPQTQLDLSGSWGPIQGAVPLKRVELVKFALRVLRSCAAVDADDAKNVAQDILSDQGTNIQIPKFFVEGNAWVLRWLCHSLSLSPQISLSLMQEVQQELKNTGSPVSVNPRSSKVQSRPQWHLWVLHILLEHLNVVIMSSH
ncbi:unnamed protein product [Merluccius merluccius]